MIYIRQRSMVSYVIVFFCVTLILCGVFGIVWLRSNFTTLEYHISELENRKIEELRETKKLMSERVTLLSLHGAGKAGASKLGMVFPDRSKVVYVKEGKITPFRASFVREKNGDAGRMAYKETW
jgi:hypothetical protein